MVSPKPTKELSGGQKLSLKSMYFNRYLVFRYLTAVFFFTNLYWLIISIGTGGYTWIIAASLLFGAGLVTIEQVKKYWKPDNTLTITHIYYWAQIVVNLLLIVSVALGQRTWFFPFLTDQSNGWLMGFLAMGIAISALLEYRIYLIEHNRDRYLQRIKQFSASL
ncbi:hypothetical protein [Companilactobacillus sp. HBUAS56257]|uniref:hypothetical protein n=1 Tax=Companilactobacillus sp. HBUAS56257 TaxID=3109360 RepID=UPI002FF27BC4